MRTTPFRACSGLSGSGALARVDDSCGPAERRRADPCLLSLSRLPLVKRLYNELLQVSFILPSA